jgi:hypothetical protein
VKPAGKIRWRNSITGTWRGRTPPARSLKSFRPVEESALPVRRTLEKIGIARATFYRWYQQPQTFESLASN